MRDQHERALVCLECLSNILSGRKARERERETERDERERESQDSRANGSIA